MQKETIYEAFEADSQKLASPGAYKPFFSA